MRGRMVLIVTALAAVLLVTVTSAVTSALVREPGPPAPSPRNQSVPPGAPGSSKSRITIGFKDDQPGLAKSSSGGRWAGFEYDLGEYLAKQLNKKKVPRGLSSDRREQALQDGEVDLVIATFSYTDRLRTRIEMAGPYLIVSQGVLVRSDNDDIRNVRDLKHRTVCAATGSTSLTEIKKDGYEIAVREEPDYSSCVRALRKGTVDAVSTDETILYGFQQRHPRDLKVVRGLRIGELSRYMVGLPAGRQAECERIAQLLRQFVESEQWRDKMRSHLPAMTEADPNFESRAKPVPETVKCWT